MALYDNSQIPFPIKIQIYPYHQYNGLTNMAVDHWFASNFENIKNPVFRFYGWNPYCLSIGYHQSFSAIDADTLEHDGYEKIKRPTGGRAIFHSEELTYSTIFPKNIFSQKELYNYMHQIFTVALIKLNFDVILAANKPKLPKLIDHAIDYPCFTRSAETEVEYKGKKLIGSAQKIYPESILQHGSILIGNSHENLSKYLVASEYERNLIDQEIKSKTICLNSINEKKISPELIEKEILKQLESQDNISLIFNQLDDEFLNKAINFYKKEFSDNV